MITRWEEIADRTAARLNLPTEVVRAEVLKMAGQTLAHASHPCVLETDVLGIGTWRATYGKIIKRLGALTGSRERKSRYLEKNGASGTGVLGEKESLRLTELIALMGRDILALEEFMEQKRGMYASHGKTPYLKTMMEGVLRKDLGPVKPKIRMSDVKIKGPGRKPGNDRAKKSPTAFNKDNISREDSAPD